MKKILNKNILRSLIFWAIMFSYLLSSNWYRDSNKWYLFEYIGFKVFLQFLLSLVILYFLVPKLLHKKKNMLFVFTTLFFIYIIQTLYGIVRIYYFEVQFPAVYEMLPPYFLWNRMTSLPAFLNNISWVSFPSIILIAIHHYRDQRDLFELREQKKTTELNLLKNQLNPHFLFNTLNNLYVLALKKSDKTPEVIAKLAEILDYILYQCKDNYVSINKEIELLENYIELEKVRYGNRVEVVFEKLIHKNINIAPLILLTFVENAFKHGVSQELNKAIITLYISTTDDEIIFKLKNTKPQSNIENTIADRTSIGMRNSEKQLDLLYPEAYLLKINNTRLDYTLELKLQLHEKI